MDPPEHGKYRKVSSSWFTPRAIQRLTAEVERITRELLDTLAVGEGEADFVHAVTAPLTLSVLADMLGVPREDWELMFRWTNQIAGSATRIIRVGGETQFETVPPRTRVPVQVLRGARSEAARRAARRHGERDRSRSRRRGAASPARAAFLLPASRCGGKRDDAQRCERRAACADREPGRAREASPRPQG